MFERTSIVIVAHNAAASVKASIDSIREHTAGAYDITLVDNGSTDGTDAWCRREQVPFVSMPWQQRYAAACNAGLKLATGDRLLIVKAGVLARSGWLEEMVSCLYSDRKIGIVSPYVLSETVPRRSFERRLAETASCDCCLLKRELLQRIGLLPEPYALDNDAILLYGHRAVDAGYVLMNTGTVTLWESGAAQLSSFTASS